ncbi:HIG1 domain family member 1A, mitochondrial [Strongylocentrotus purpuratus]|uniref:HIG1 domain-containing protein n=1 Tax=Strongylocentrotus purpuratus TaxID=7668 RepID=A0A7M7REY4_STRPU|nr:HIG1 domain family member 1A, mitochondrial [Strongylocentrotus purpuratus]|eukprot:XP_786453.1 PREDICTED: HIG1 domain family member 1A, mitochondrial [Strongylocentrotus purpuratus]
MSRPVIEYETESATDKLKRKALADPYVPVGILGFVGALAWGAYSYKSRGNTSTSIFLMRLRVVAQTCVVGAMAVGAGVTMWKRSSPDKET